MVTDTRDAILLGYISRSELRAALDQSRNLDRMTECHFSALPPSSSSLESYLDLRPWMDQTPITLPQQSSLQLTITLFQKLGLRYILFSTHGQLQGLLTKKDAAFAVNTEGGDIVSGIVTGDRSGHANQHPAHAGQVSSLLREVRGGEGEEEDDDERSAHSDSLTGL